MHDRLVERSRKALSSAYAPYSGHAVGAALATEDGCVHVGCNIEVDGLRNTLHAEEVAVADAVESGAEGFEALSVSSETGATPCGRCRQTLHEFCGGELTIFVDSVGDDDVTEHTLADLYPSPFPDRDANLF